MNYNGTILIQVIILKIIQFMLFIVMYWCSF